MLTKCSILISTCVIYRVRQIPFFLKNALKKLLNIFSNFFFYFQVQFFRLITENNLIQMAASACHAVAHTINLIFKHIIDCVQLCQLSLAYRCNTYL